MARATRGFAAIFFFCGLTLAACNSGRENSAGGGPAANQGNLTEEPFTPPGGQVDTPTNDGSEAVGNSSSTGASVTNEH